MNISKKQEQALAHFAAGNNCTQAVLHAFKDELQFDSTTAHAIASGFGGGMGGQQKTCGALTGAYMVLGIQHQEQPQEVNPKVQAASVHFVEKFGASSCRNIIACDLSTPEGQAKAQKQEVFAKICTQCVKEAVSFCEQN